MTDRDDERWIALSEREAAGETLTAAERDFCARMIESNALCATEDAMLRELSNLDAQPDAGSRAREEAVLAAFWNEQDGATTVPTAADRSSSVQVSAGARWRLPVIGLAAAAAVLAAIGLERMEATAPVAHVDAPSGRVELVYASGQVTVDAHPATFGQLLPEGSIVSVTQGAACLAIDPGIDVCLREQSSLRVTKTKSSSRRVDLIRGNATAAIDPQPAGSQFSIVAGDVWSTAVGTAYAVSRDPNGSVETVVLSGKVLVGPQDKQRTVHAHERAKVVGNVASIKPVVRAEESPHWAAIKTTELWSDPKTATLIVKATDRAAKIWLDGEVIGDTPLSSLIPTGEHALKHVLEDGRVVEQQIVATAGETLAFDLDALPEAQAPSTEQLQEMPTKPALRSAVKGVEPAPASATELLSLAREHMRAERWSDAAHAYRQVQALHPDSTEAKTVSVSLAKLALEHLREPGTALRDLDVYLAQGGGALSQEARYLRIEALRALGRHDVALDAARAFLDDYPSSFQAQALRTELANGRLASGARTE